MASATEQLKEQAGLAKRPILVKDLIQSMRPQIALALPKFLDPDRMIRIAFTCMRLNPKLEECTPDSLLASIMILSQLGLEPGVRGQSYLVPYWNSKQKRLICQAIPGWMGMVGLVHRSGQAQVSAAAVYEGDLFHWQLGSDPKIVHEPCGDERKMTHAYAVGKIKGCEWPVIEVWTADKIWKHRDKVNKVGDAHYSHAWPDQYAKKVPLLQVIKYLPQSISLSAALSLDDAAETGGQSYSIKDVPGVVEGTVVAQAEPEPEQGQAEKLPEMCADCRQTINPDGSGHHKLCKHAKTPTAEAQPAQDEAPAPKVGELTKKQLDRLWAIAGGKSISNDDVHVYVKETHGGKTSVKDLTREEYDDVCAWMESQ